MVMPGTVEIRPATRNDMPAIIKLAPMTVPGFVEHLWARMASAGETPEEFGARVQQEFVDKGFTQIVEVDGNAAGFLVSYVLPETAEPHVAGTDPALGPLVHLFGHAAGDHYVHGLATFEGYRGRGLASKLLANEEKRAFAEGRRRLSLIVIESNRAATAFYARRGFHEMARAPVADTGWTSIAQDWLLLSKPLTSE